MTNEPIRGVYESNPLGDFASSDVKRALDTGVYVDWRDDRLHKVTRLRLLSDFGYPYWDVSYCIGVLKDGTPCRVGVGFSELPKRKMRRAIVAHAKRDGVHAKSLGIFDAISRR